MRLQLIFEKVSLTGDIKEKIEKKFANLDKYMRNVSADLRQGFVKLSKGDRWGYKVKIGVKTPKKEVVVEETDAELLTAVDKAEQKISRVVRKTIEKMPLAGTSPTDRKGPDNGCARDEAPHCSSPAISHTRVTVKSPLMMPPK